MGISQSSSKHPAFVLKLEVINQSDCILAKQPWFYEWSCVSHYGLQQFYNALKRKGKEAPAENIDMMVDIHNFLNEACWQEIVKWEQRFHCDCKNLRLIKFQGRPDELSPKAWFYTNFRGFVSFQFVRPLF